MRNARRAFYDSQINEILKFWQLTWKNLHLKKVQNYKNLRVKEGPKLTGKFFFWKKVQSFEKLRVRGGPKFWKIMNEKNFTYEKSPKFWEFTHKRRSKILPINEKILHLEKNGQKFCEFKRKTGPKFWQLMQKNLHLKKGPKFWELTRKI